MALPEYESGCVFSIASLNYSLSGVARVLGCADGYMKSEGVYQICRKSPVSKLRLADGTAGEPAGGFLQYQFDVQFVLPL